MLKCKRFSSKPLCAASFSPRLRLGLVTRTCESRIISTVYYHHKLILKYLSTELHVTVTTPTHIGQGKFRTLTHPYARNTPGSICQCKEDGLVSRPPSLFTSMRRPMHVT